MTEKQQNIVNAALELFATDGVDATSTNKIAKAAGVSTVVFDRGGNRYLGQVAALADAAREAGLEF